MSKSPKKPVTRYGVVSDGTIKFGTEERFSWQKAKYVSDVVYELPDMTMSRSVIFGSSLRKGMADDGPKSSTGPGSYDFAHCYDHSSEYPTKKGNRFAAAPRQSMAVKTPSPGPVYNIEKCYYTGPEKNQGIAFNCDSRQPLYGSGAGSNADMLWPKLPKGPSITIGSRLKRRDPTADGPGAIYDVHKKMNFQTGPKFSFGKGKGDRFRAFGFLKELD